jgi:hypothetical protein
MFGGLPLLFGHAKLPLLGLVLMLIGLLHWRNAALPYAVVISTLTAEYQVLESENPLHIDNLISALNVAKALRDIR